MSGAPAVSAAGPPSARAGPLTPPPPHPNPSLAAAPLTAVAPGLRPLPLRLRVPDERATDPYFKGRPDERATEAKAGARARTGKTRTVYRNTLWKLNMTSLVWAEASAGPAGTMSASAPSPRPPPRARHNMVVCVKDLALP